MSGNFEVVPCGTLQRLAQVEAERDSMREILDHIPQVEAELAETSDKLHAMTVERDALLAVVQAYIVWSEAEHEKDPKSTTFRERIEMCREVDELARATFAKVKGGGNG